MKKIVVIAIIAMILGNINSAKAQSSAQVGGYNLWYEFGDGTFINTSFGSTDSLMNYFDFGIPVNNGNNNGPLLGIKKTVPLYKPPTPPPPPDFKFFGYQPTDEILPNSYATTPMPAEKNLYLHTSTVDFLLEDSIYFAINYSKPVNATKVCIFYNSNAKDVFIPINNITSTTTYPNTNNNTILNIPNIRMYNGEIASIATASMFNANKPGSGFNNGLVFSINSSGTNNIFLTLFTNKTILTTANEIFKVVYLDGNNNVIGSPSYTTCLNHSKLKSHDPNNQSVYPNCLEIKDATNNINNIIKYHINFQNVGLGDAEYVKTTTTLPNGYSLADLVTNNTSLSWKIANMLRNNDYTAQIIPTNNDNQLCIEFKKNSTKPILKGTLHLSNPLHDANTMGEFDFELKLHANINTEQDLSSNTAIVFDNNLPIITNSAIIKIRNSCNCWNNCEVVSNSLFKEFKLVLNK